MVCRDEFTGSNTISISPSFSSVLCFIVRYSDIFCFCFFFFFSKKARKQSDYQGETKMAQISNVIPDKAFTKEEVALHNTETDCWLIMHFTFLGAQVVNHIFFFASFEFFFFF